LRGEISAETTSRILPRAARCEGSAITSIAVTEGPGWSTRRAQSW
jgi:hypothetical protein